MSRTDFASECNKRLRGSEVTRFVDRQVTCQGPQHSAGLVTLNDRGEQVGEIPCCNLNQDCLAWAACGKPLVSIRKTSRSRDLSRDETTGGNNDAVSHRLRRAMENPCFDSEGIEGMGFLKKRTFCGQPALWKTLVSIRWLQGYGMSEQANIS